MHTFVTSSIKDGLANLGITKTIAWETKPGTQFFKTRLRNNLGRALVLQGQVCGGSLHRITFLIRDELDNKANVYRLCIRGNHGNRRSDHQMWDPGTHLHVWCKDFHAKRAEQPWAPWPPVPWSDDSQVPLTNDEMRYALTLFCGMLNIAFDDRAHWVDPPSAKKPSPVKLFDGDEVP